jgi:hypothetical protein
MLSQNISVLAQKYGLTTNELATCILAKDLTAYALVCEDGTYTPILETNRHLADGYWIELDRFTLKSAVEGLFSIFQSPTYRVKFTKPNGEIASGAYAPGTGSLDVLKIQSKDIPILAGCVSELYGYKCTVNQNEDKVVMTINQLSLLKAATKTLRHTRKENLRKYVNQTSQSWNLSKLSKFIAADKNLLDELKCVSRTPKSIAKTLATLKDSLPLVAELI